MEVDSDEENDTAMMADNHLKGPTGQVSYLEAVEAAIYIILDNEKIRREKEERKGGDRPNDVWDSKELYIDNLIEVFVSLVQSSMEFGVERTLTQQW
jgi:hypothetical protein